MQRSENVDVDIKGTSGLADILREIGRSERKTQQLLDCGNDHKLNLQQFKDLVSPSPPPGSAGSCSSGARVCVLAVAVFDSDNIPIFGSSVLVPTLRRARMLQLLASLQRTLSP